MTIDRLLFTRSLSQLLFRNKSNESNKSITRLNVVVHEFIHLVQLHTGAFIYFEKNLREGLTQYYADKIIEEQRLTKSTTHNYGIQVECATEFIRKLGIDGEEIVSKAFFNVDLTPLIERVKKTHSILHFSNIICPSKRSANLTVVYAELENLSIMNNPIDGATYIKIPAGEFEMGSTEEEISQLIVTCEHFLGSDCRYAAYYDELSQHTVYLDDFWIMQTEVTNNLYKKCVEANVCTPPTNGYWNAEEWKDFPVTHIDWHQAVKYSAWVKGRLPTEAEWEKACRGPNESAYPWGEIAPSIWEDIEPNIELANYKKIGVGSKPTISKVMSYTVGSNSLYDMAGNVWEWTNSLYRVYPYDYNDGREALSVSEEQADLESSMRVRRGGSFAYYGLDTRCANRVGNRSTGIDAQVGSIGFRVVIDK